MLFEFGFIHSVVCSSVSHLASRFLLILVLCRLCDVICFVAQELEKTIFCDTSSYFKVTSSYFLILSPNNSGVTLKSLLGN